ncbi:hypothetical protein MC28_E060 (plasmid) [Bacillus thuringiensis MC28]|nr:hypothetical protein MC28_E060 [Bacillus thuringiensis MC28]
MLFDLCKVDCIKIYFSARCEGESIFIHLQKRNLTILFIGLNKTGMLVIPA